jgi:hypothetical protein
LNKNEFWSQIRKIRRDNNKVNINIEKLKEKFEKTFNESIFENQNQRKKANERLKKFEERVKMKLVIRISTLT